MHRNLLTIAFGFLSCGLCYASTSASIPPDLIGADPAIWKVERAEGYSAKKDGHQEFLFAVSRQIRKKADHEWAMTLTLFNSPSPDLWIWLDHKNEMQKGLRLSDGTIAVSDGRIDFNVVSREHDSPYGTIRVTMHDESDKVVAQREFRTWLVSAPSYCNLEKSALWQVGDHSLGAISQYHCSENETGMETDWRVLGFEADFEWVFETWNVGKTVYAALTLPNADRVVAPITDAESCFHWDDDSRTMTIQLTLNGKLYQRIVRPKPALTLRLPPSAKFRVRQAS